MRGLTKPLRPRALFGHNLTGTTVSYPASWLAWGGDDSRRSTLNGPTPTPTFEIGRK